MPNEILIAGKLDFRLAPYQEVALGAGQIRGRTLYTLVSQGTEIGWANGEDFPVRPGYSAVFLVEEIGADVTGIRKRDLRFAMGYHRSTQTHEAAHTLPLPKGLDPMQATIARLMGVSMSTLMTTRARTGDRVLIVGAGPVGFLAGQLFGIGGYEVTMIEPNALRRDQLASAGFADVRAAMPLEDLSLKGQVALVVDCSGHEGAVIEACQMVRRMGEVVLVGVPWKKLTDRSAFDVMQAVFFNHVLLRSGWEWELPIHGRGFQWEELLEGYNNAPHSIFGGFARALGWLAEGRIRLDGLVHVARPDDPAALYDRVMKRQIDEPFIVLDWTGAD